MAFCVIVKLRRVFVESSNGDGRGRQHYTLHAVPRLVTWTSDPQRGERGQQHGGLHLLHPGHAGEEDGGQAGEAEQGEPRGGREPSQDRQRADHRPAQQVSTRYLASNI